MEETKQLEINSPQGEMPFAPQQQVHIEPCSWNKCVNGHTWPPSLAVAKCGGCGGLVLAVKMEQCPLCNEPVVKVKFRTDHLPQGARVVAVCRGEQGQAEMGDIEMERNHWKEVEKYDKDGDNHSRRIAGDLKRLPDGGERTSGCEGGDVDGEAKRDGEVCTGGGESAVDGGVGTPER